jgi:predicted metal-dependent peptidase
MPSALAGETGEVYRGVRVNWRALLSVLSTAGAGLWRENRTNASRGALTTCREQALGRGEALLAVDESGSVYDAMERAFLTSWAKSTASTACRFRHGV